MDSINVQIIKLILENLEAASLKFPKMSFGELLIKTEVLETERVGNQFDYDVRVTNPSGDNSLSIYERMGKYVK